MVDWLKSGGCEMAAMESTASYWKPLYNILESSDLNAMVVNARHMKAVPGRKTDVKDAEWIADLLGERTRELNRLQKMLEGANIKLSGTVSDSLSHSNCFFRWDFQSYRFSCSTAGYLKIKTTFTAG